MGYVYKITNTVNNKSYIGISIHEPEKDRIRDHFSGNGNRVIANAVKKYGKDALIYEILEANVFDEFLPHLEVEYIARYKTMAPHGYNLTSGGEVTKRLSNETRQKISESKKGKMKGEKHHLFGKKHTVETRKKISQSKKGKKYSAEFRRKVSEATKGENNPFFGKKHSKETRKKISQSKKNPSEETRQKLSKSARGRNISEETRRKISQANTGKNKHIDYEYVYSYFISLPPDMPLTEKRQWVFDKFANIPKPTIYKWISKWSSS